MDGTVKKMANTDPDAFGCLRELVISDKVVKLTESESWTQSLLDQLTWKPRPLHNDVYDHLVKQNYHSLQLVPFSHRFVVGMFDRNLLKDRIKGDPPPATPPTPPVNFYGARHVGIDPNLYIKSLNNYRSSSFDSYVLEKIGPSKFEEE